MPKSKVPDEAKQQRKESEKKPLTQKSLEELDSLHLVLKHG